MPTPRIGLVLTCEHAGNRVPAAYRALFASAAAQRVLATHRGYDPGAHAVARAMARRLRTPLHAHLVTRLLVEPNRSPGHPALWSRFSRGLAVQERAALLAAHYTPHRAAVERALRDELRRHPTVAQVGVHSFTPRLRGQARRADVGLLYDPRREREAELCKRWQAALRAAAPQLVVRRNYPYRGSADGLTTQLRRTLGPRYLGIELELNQARLADAGVRERFARLLAGTLAPLLR